MHLAEKKISCKALKSSYPEYFLSKKKLELESNIDINKIMIKEYNIILNNINYQKKHEIV